MPRARTESTRPQLGQPLKVRGEFDTSAKSTRSKGVGQHQSGGTQLTGLNWLLYKEIHTDKGGKRQLVGAGKYRSAGRTVWVHPAFIRDNLAVFEFRLMAVRKSYNLSIIQV